MGPVALTVLNGGITTQLHQALRRGVLDTLIRREIFSVYGDSALNRVYSAFGIMDEPYMPNHRAFGLLSRKVQENQFLKDPTRKRQVFTPLYANYNSVRVFSNDYDTSNVKTMQ